MFPLTLIIIADRTEKVKRKFKISIDKVLTIGGPGKKWGVFAYYSPARAPQADGRIRKEVLTLLSSLDECFYFFIFCIYYTTLKVVCQVAKQKNELNSSKGHFEISLNI